MQRDCGRGFARSGTRLGQHDELATLSPTHVHARALHAATLTHRVYVITRPFVSLLDHR